MTCKKARIHYGWESGVLAGKKKANLAVVGSL